jgi:exopolysaccharide biosynthesis polyprenyl glycosylphosphotransferase
LSRRAGWKDRPEERRHRREPPDEVELDDVVATDEVDARTVQIVDRHARSNAARRTRLVNRLLVAADCVGLVMAYVAARLTYPEKPFLAGSYSGTEEFEIFLATLPLWLAVARLYGVYRHDADADHSTADDAPAVVNLMTLGAWLLYVVTHLTGWAEPDLGKVVTFWGVAIAATLLARGVARLISRHSMAFVQNAIIIGAGDVGQLVGRKLLQHPEYAINLVGFVDDHPRARGGSLARLCRLGGVGDLAEIVRRFDVERAIVAFSEQPHEETLQLVRRLADAGLQVDIVPRLFEVVSPGTAVHSVEGLPLMSLPPPRLSRPARLAKRCLDVVGASLALLLLAPLFAVVAALIELDSPGAVFFRQARIGEGARLFRIWKFRTMTADAEARKNDYLHLNMHGAPGGDPRMFKIPDDPRVTRVGRTLRRFAIDELPQLFNVLRGEMSLVGPRPLIPDEHRFVTEWAQKRLELRPGMTGSWQVLGRSGIPFDEMVRLDYQYVSTWSLWNDMRLLTRTLPVVLRANGGY